MPPSPHLPVLAVSTLVGGQNEARPGRGWQDPEEEEGKSCPVLVGGGRGGRGEGVGKEEGKKG